MNIILPGRGDRCHVKDCPGISTAFLQVELKAGDDRVVKQSIGYCQPHAIEKHKQLVAKKDPRYRVTSFTKPNKLKP